MAWNGSGTYIQVTPVASGSTVWADTKAAGDLTITTADHDYHDQDMAAGITLCLTKDGQNSPTDNLPMASNRHTNVGDAVLVNEYASLGQLIRSGGLSGVMTNASMIISTAAATATFTANGVVVAANLSSRPYRLFAYSQAVNLGTTGAGGMDTGLAPVSGYVALYAIFNPVTLATSILGVDTTSAVAPAIYGGANLPAGYTASALISVWPTDAARNFVVGVQVGRTVKTALRRVISTSVQQASPVLLSIASAVPGNANTIDFNFNNSSTASGLLVAQISSNTFTGRASIELIGTVMINNVSGLLVSTPQTIFYVATAGAGTMTFTIDIYAYTF